MLAGGSRSRVLALCGLAVAALVAVAAAAPLPFSVAQPGLTADVLGRYRGEKVITVSGAETSRPEGELLMTTIAATGPDASIHLGDVLRGWFATDRAVMPRDSVYPVGDTPREIREHGTAQMRKSQTAAVTAALRELGVPRGDVDVDLRLEDVGGPSAGLLFTLGVIAELEDDPRALTGGRTIAGTGTIDAAGNVGPVGGVPLKTRAAARDGATVFLVPRAECADARTDLPDGLRLVPVTDLDGALSALEALSEGGSVPACPA
ncbi:S16 family serine protease [Streptomyces sp. TR06-5]|uniref:S16 family serine protease n=1 Tax=unclassified Streptomyces TaxID=2593676 RepID=UPI0039A1CF6B